MNQPQPTPRTNLTTITVQGPDLLPYLPDISRLRVAVFQEYPYLYLGDPDNEQGYLEAYTASTHAMAVLALDNQRVVGASTGVPLENEHQPFQQPFIDRGIDPASVFYGGESILLPQYRGQGVYRAFIVGREQYAQRLQRFKWFCFCAVVRPPDDPRKPADYQPLDPVWRRFGYQPQPGMTTTFTWRELDSDQPVEHPMQFWMKPLSNQQPASSP